MKAVVILPTYNERENIISMLDRLIVAAAKIKSHTLDYLIVDDNSPDGTGQLIKKYQKTHYSVYLLQGEKSGLGKALLRGANYAIDKLHADAILQMDADTSHSPESIPDFFQAMDRGADFVVGSRYIPGGSIPGNWGLHRKIFSITGNAIVRYGLGYPKIHDWTGGFRLYKKSYFEKVKNQLTPYSGYVFQIAFLHKSVMSGAKITEVPIQFTDRMFGHSKIAPSQYIRDVLGYVISERFKQLISGNFLKFLAVGGIGFVLNALILVLLHNYLHWSASISNLIGAAVAIFSNYNLNNLWTFQVNKITKIGQYFIKLVQFYGASLFGVIVIQTGTIELGTRTIGDRYYFIYFLIGTSLLLIWNYMMYSRVIWKK